jgi:hypothetical protein
LEKSSFVEAYMEEAHEEAEEEALKMRFFLLPFGLSFFNVVFFVLSMCETNSGFRCSCNTD